MLALTSATRAYRLDRGALDAMEPPAAKKLAAGARKPRIARRRRSQAGGRLARRHCAQAQGEAPEGPRRSRRHRRARAVQQHLEKFQRPFTAAQLWENTQRVVAKKEIVAVRAQRPGRARRWRAVEQFRESITPRACARLAAEGDIAVKEFQGGKVLLYYAEPDAMARKHARLPRRPTRSATSASTAAGDHW